MAKSIIGAFALSAVLSASPVVSAGGFYSGHDIYQLSISDHAAFRSYIAGLADESIFLRDFGAKHGYCIPGTARLSSVVAAVERHMSLVYHEHPEHLSLRASRHFAFAMIEAYPCGGDGNE